VLVQTKKCNLHFYVDHRKVNDVTKKDYFPLPMTEDIFDILTGVSTLNLKSGYWQVSLLPNNKGKTGFFYCSVAVVVHSYSLWFLHCSSYV
jgi:hypothetical protein